MRAMRENVVGGQEAEKGKRKGKEWGGTCSAGRR
jgi:hypothetical protein